MILWRMPRLFSIAWAFELYLTGFKFILKEHSSPLLCLVHLEANFVSLIYLSKQYSIRWMINLISLYADARFLSISAFHTSMRQVTPHKRNKHQQSVSHFSVVEPIRRAQNRDYPGCEDSTNEQSSTTVSLQPTTIIDMANACISAASRCHIPTDPTIRIERAAKDTDFDFR